jgi:hypothetical protein
MTRFSRAAAKVILALASLLLASSDGLLRAQGSSTPQRQLLMISETQLKPETAPEWAELQKSELIPAQKKGGLLWRDAWTGGPGGDPYLRAVVTPISSLAQFDNPNPLAKVLGEQGFAAYTAKARRLVASAHSTIVTTRPDLGFGTRPAVHKLAILTVVNVTNGRNGEFESFLKADIVPALKKGGATYYSVSQTVFGGDANQYMTLLPANDFAELAKGHPLERALGPDAMVKLGQKSAAFISRIERRIIRYLPDLSYGPSAPTSH